MVLTRIRVRFDFTPVNYARKCWFVFDSDQCSLVRDVAYLILTHFELQNNQEHNGIELYMDDYLIPANESSEIIRDNDVIEVKASCASPLKKPSSGASLSSGSDDLQPKTKKRKKANSKVTSNRGQDTQDTPATKRPKIDIFKSSATPASLPKPPRPLRTVSTKSASGGVHTKFQSSSDDTSSTESSTSSSTDSSSDTEPNSKQTSRQPPVSNDKPFNKTNTLSQKNPLVSNKPVQKTPGKNNNVKKSTPRTTPVSRDSKQTNRTFDKRAHGETTANVVGRGRIPLSRVIVGGPDDVLTTRSKVYNRTVNTNNDSRITVSPKQLNGVHKSGTRVDKVIVSDSANDSVTVSEPVCDYSIFPDLQGAPRIGDKLAFKLLELTSSCTPEVSDYREADVLSYDVTTKTVRMKYTDTTLKKMQKGLSLALMHSPTLLAKFFLDDEQEEADLIHSAGAGHHNETDHAVVELSLDTLISPKLLSNQ